MKKIIALAAVAVATVAGASTNYAERVARYHNPAYVVFEMTRDSELADADALRAALEDLDKTVSTGKVEFEFRVLSRRLPLTARAYFAKFDHFTKKAAEDALAVCDYDAETRTIDLGPSDPGYANFALQLACIGGSPVSAIRTGILNAAIVPVRRAIRAEGGSFVGKEGAKLVKAKLDALAVELNAPRFGKAGKLLAEIGMDVEWEFIQSRILDDAKVAEIKTRLLGGEIPFDGTLQNKLCVALGVEAYNAFVTEYNGKEGNRE